MNLFNLVRFFALVFGVFFVAQALYVGSAQANDDYEYTMAQNDEDSSGDDEYVPPPEDEEEPSEDSSEESGDE